MMKIGLNRIGKVKEPGGHPLTKVPTVVQPQAISQILCFRSRGSDRTILPGESFKKNKPTVNDSPWAKGSSDSSSC